jgi:hypothetical protein
MAFKVRNLMIHVLPGAQGNAQSQPGLAFADACAGLTFLGAQAPWCPTFTPLPPLLPPAQSNPEALATLKAQLQEALANVEAQEKALNEQLAPQTLEEAEALEGHLVDALAEVRQRIGELQSKEDGGQA